MEQKQQQEEEKKRQLEEERKQKEDELLKQEAQEVDISEMIGKFKDHKETTGLVLSTQDASSLAEEAQ